MKIEVLGPGCIKCQTMLRHVEEALAQAKIPSDQVELVKVEDVFDIAAHGVQRTPALAIDGQLKLQGRVATVDEIKQWLQEK